MLLIAIRLTFSVAGVLFKDDHLLVLTDCDINHTAGTVVSIGQRRGRR